MRIICFLFFTIVTSGIRKSAADADTEDGGYEAIVDTKVVEYEENEETEAERPNRKDRVKTIKNFVGTNLFGETGCRKKCFSSEDIALLAARRDFESLIPKDLPNCLLDDELARILMQYFYGANQVIEKMAGGHSKIFAQKAFYDTLGGYLKYYMIPISRYSYYAGLIKLRTVGNVLELYSQCKNFLNTNGNNWRLPITDFSDMDIQTEPLRIIVRNDEEDTSCIQLDMLDEHAGEDSEMIVALPRLDQEERGILGNMWLPFKRKRTFNLRSCMSAFVVLRYFELTTRCYSFQGICQDTFNKKFKEWILENLEIHFGDDVLYPGLGAILRIVETLRRKNKDTVIAAKTSPKRQKTHIPNSQENKVSHSDENVAGMRNNVFIPNDPFIFNEYTDESYNVSNLEDDRMKYIYIAIGVAISLLILVFLGIVLALYKKWKSRKANKPLPGKEKTNWFGRKSRKDDGVVVLNAKSSSIASGNKSKLSSKTRSSSKSKKDSKKSRNDSPPEAPKCFSFCTKKNDPAIIGTTSMNSDSAKNKKNKKKAQSPGKSQSPAKSKKTKTAVVDEKKRFTISKKNKQKDARQKSPSKLGIFRKNT